MKRTMLVGIITIIAVGACGVLIAYQKNSDKSAAHDAVATNQVAIKDYMFSPMIITVKVGTTVTWTNNDAAHHTVSSYDGRMPGSQELAEGQTYSHTFTKTGTYKYHCTPHPNMKGTVIVTN